jgi:SAM-dependent methyltransferase
LDVANESGFNCFGIDPDPVMVAQAHASGHKVMRGYFPQDVPRDVMNLDFVVFNDALEHIPNLRSTLQATWSLLRPQGIAVINLPLSEGMFYRLSSLVYRLGIRAGLERLWQFGFHSPHFYYFNKQSLVYALRREGFYQVAYHRVKTLDTHMIKDRIAVDANLARFASFLAIPVTLLSPMLHFASEDVGCMYARKGAHYSAKV